MRRTSKKAPPPEVESIPTEHEEQCGFVQWFRRKFPHVRIMAIPNGGWRNAATAGKLKAEGVSRVYVVDIMQKRLDKALELGADGVINSREKDAVQTILDLTDGLGCDLVIETAGTEITTRQAIEMAQKGANIVLVGYSKSGEMTLPMSLALDKELTFKTVFRYRHIYPMAIDAVASGKINLKGIVTNIFDFDDIQNAMDKSISDKANIVKAVVKIAEETKV